MLSITGLKRFYFLPHLHDMRCKAPRISEVIKCHYNRNPCNGDVYIYILKSAACLFAHFKIRTVTK